MIGLQGLMPEFLIESVVWFEEAELIVGVTQKEMPPFLAVPDSASRLA